MSPKPSRELFTSDLIFKSNSLFHLFSVLFPTSLTCPATSLSSNLILYSVLFFFITLPVANSSTNVIATQQIVLRMNLVSSSYPRFNLQNKMPHWIMVEDSGTRPFYCSVGGTLVCISLLTSLFQFS